MSVHHLTRTLALSCAIVVGVLAAFLWNEAGSSNAAYATFHCTRYAPVYSVDDHCSTSAYFPGGPNYYTNSVALRDSNWVSMYDIRYWEMCLFTNGWCLDNTFFWGESRGAWSGVGSGSVYAKAYCYHAGDWTLGFCETDWHT
jgi:hypothetical protein